MGESGSRNQRDQQSDGLPRTMYLGFLGPIQRPPNKALKRSNIVLYVMFYKQYIIVFVKTYHYTIARDT